CADQPLLGFTDLVVVVSANDFSSCTSGNPLYLGVQYWVLNKTDLVSGAPARTMSFGPDPTLFSVHPVQSLGSTDTQFMVSTGSGPTSTLTLFTVIGVPPGLVLVSKLNLGIRSTATDYPEMRVATRSAHDPPSTIGAPQVIRLGEGPEASGCPNNSVCRYGDYFGAARDPSDPGIVWVAGEYGTATGWATFIAAMAQTVQLTLAYSVQGGGSAYIPPTLTYVRGGQSVTVPLTTVPTAYAVDAVTAWSVSAVLGGSGANERWATHDTV